MSKPIVVFEVWIPGTIRGKTSSELTFEAVRDAGAEVVLINARAGQPLPDYRDYCAAIIPGSNSMVTDREEWSESLAAWARESHAAGLPLLGICFGHQLIAHALGGEVGNLVPTPEMGTVDVMLLEAATSDDLLRDLPRSFLGHASHYQSVNRLPAGAVNLARSAIEPHQAFRAGPSTWGVQFHPELSFDFMMNSLVGHRQELELAKVDVDLAVASLAQTPVAATVIDRFVKLMTTR